MVCFQGQLIMYVKFKAKHKTLSVPIGKKLTKPPLAPVAVIREKQFPGKGFCRP